MDLLTQFLDVFLHLDTHLNEWAASLGIWLYLLLFIIIFCETGLVVTPFLPGDSLLFAVGALCATTNAAIDFQTTCITLFAAAIIGDALNYSIGKWIGPKIFEKSSRFLNKEHLLKTQRFYEKHGGKTIVIARFMPIVRTFAPFVAGIGRMAYRKFALYNVVGALLWTVGFLAAGYYFGNLPEVKRNFHIVVFAIIGISVLPMAVEILKSRALKSRMI